MDDRTVNNHRDLAKDLSAKDPGVACEILDSLEEEDAKLIFTFIEALARRGHPVARRIALRAVELKLHCAEPPVRASENVDYGASAPL